ncbi:hypothetical protein H0486_07495 [Lachnospiraceae bacterium MD1]|jgi:hypothetical protein|uniref:Uncharacterized protein n=1 Tax=Variimorphobacter saccharofermentans TaxID=2755051 RepID=A0A839JZV8_9FIRM|nr:hypothetical protein [Variimorphobacter saccharofermentans]MBB2182718.1 hypothetical protein [Variimorphobacter saccharofermentans]
MIINGLSAYKALVYRALYADEEPTGWVHTGSKLEAGIKSSGAFAFVGT